MGNKIPAAILDKEEALSRWEKDALSQLQSTFESVARINQKDKMSKSVFENYAFPFIPRELVERLYIVFQLQIVDETLKYNYKRSNKLNARFRTNSTSPSSSSSPKRNNMFVPPSNANGIGTNSSKSNGIGSKMNKLKFKKNSKDSPSTKIKTKKKKKKKALPRKIGKVPFLSFTVSFDQFVIGMTIILYGTDREKMLLFWRMFDIEHSDKLSYFDMRDILDILSQIDTDFHGHSIDEILDSLFQYQSSSDNPENVPSKRTRIGDHESKESVDRKVDQTPSPNSDDLNPNDLNPNDLGQSNESRTSPLNPSDFDLDELIESKMQELELKSALKTSPSKSGTEAKTDENTILLKNQATDKRIRGDSKGSSPSPDPPATVEEDAVQDKVIGFEHFYEWSLQFALDHDSNNNENNDTNGNHEGNPFISWLCSTFPPPPIEPVPPRFASQWKSVYLNGDDESSGSLNDRFGYLCSENPEIYVIAERSNC